MKLILITGLDGSGKSSLLTKLEENSTGGGIAFLRVPKIDSHLFENNKILFGTSCFINHLHAQADELKIPQLKVIAMFSAMLVFKELLNELAAKSPLVVFCERHPLIDTAVYAYFYSGSKMNPKNVAESIFQQLNNKYNNELAYLHSLLKLPETGNPALSYLYFIHKQFSSGDIISTDKLSQLFNIGLPDKIYYLDAKPEVLMQRLKQRESRTGNTGNMEAHETVKAFEKMQPVYKLILDNANTEIENINANSFKNLDKTYNELQKEFLK